MINIEKINECQNLQGNEYCVKETTTQQKEHKTGQYHREQNPAQLNRFPIIPLIENIVTYTTIHRYQYNCSYNLVGSIFVPQ